YFQTSEERIDSARFEGARRQLSWREWFLGGIVGRAYVPLVDTTTERTGEEYRILVPIANPETAHELADLAGGIAADKKNAVVSLTHVVQTFDPHSDYTDDAGDIVSESDARLKRARRAVEAHDVECESSTVVSHRPFREVFEVADYDEVDLICMRHGEEVQWAACTSERRFEELLGGLPCDVLVFQDRGLDPERVLLPVMETPNAALGGEITRALVDSFDSQVTLVHTVDSDRRERGEQFLENWAIDHGLEDADLVLDDSGDVEAAIEGLLEDHTLLVVGALERGLLGRLLHESLCLQTLEDVEQSILLVERPTDRGLLARLLGR
ncbi:MAG: universal stress protein, partial [Halorhabdus sp.]